MSSDDDESCGFFDALEEVEVEGNDNEIGHDDMNERKKLSNFAHSPSQYISARAFLDLSNEASESEEHSRKIPLDAADESRKNMVEEEATMTLEETGSLQSNSSTVTPENAQLCDTDYPIESPISSTNTVPADANVTKCNDSTALNPVGTLDTPQGHVESTSASLNLPNSHLNQLIADSSRPTFKTMYSSTELVDPDDRLENPVNPESINEEEESVGDEASSASSEHIDRRAIYTASRTSQQNSFLSSSQISNESGSSSASKMFKIVDKDTGETYDVRKFGEKNSSGDIDDGFDAKYTLFPTKGDLLEIHNFRNAGSEGDLSNCSDLISAVTEEKEVKKGLSSMIKNKLTSKDGKKAGNESIVSDTNDLNLEASTRLEDENSQSQTSVLPTKSDTRLKKKEDKPSKRLKNVKKQGKLPINQFLPKNTLSVKCVGKPSAHSDFNPMLLTYTLTKVHKGPIWCTAFSIDGNYFATGGMDGVILVWEVCPAASKKGENMDNEAIDEMWMGKRDTEKGNEKTDGTASKQGEEEKEELLAPPLTTANTSCVALGTEVKLLSSEPLRRFSEHAKDVVDLSWSGTNFLLSASLDKTVRLWHPSRVVCLKMFRHADLVTSVAFHPTDDRFFLTGGFDKKIRVWSIPDGRVKEWAQAPDFISTGRYVPNARYIAVGLFSGKVIFYSVDGLKYYTEISCKDKRSKNGKKVTGLSFLTNLSQDKLDDNSQRSPTTRESKSKKSRGASRLKPSFKGFSGNVKKRLKEQVLVTTNDSRLRMIGLDDFCMVRKYKGATNSSLQIKARFSESGEFIICGSESGVCTIWNTATKRNPLQVNVTGINNYDKVKSFECFEASKADPPIVTDATFVPSQSMKSALLSSGMFPTLYSVDHITHDMSSAGIVTCDYEGTIRVFIRRSSLDVLFHAAGPSSSM